MRSAKPVILLCCLFLASACKSKGDEEGGAVNQKAADEINEAGENLLARRDVLLKARSKIRDEKTKLEEERAKIAAEGGDTSIIDQRATELEAEERKLSDEEGVLDDKWNQLMVKTVNAASDGVKTAAREAGVAQREKDMARREERLSAREQSLADRERKLAKREAETCGVGQTQTIVQTVDVKGSKYRKSDVDPLLKRARKEMSKKGILKSDLPDSARGLEGEATKAMASGDYGQAYFSANQLVRDIRSIRIDKNFIGAKIGRLNRQIGSKSLAAGQQREVDDLFRKATAEYGDGKYSSANSRLNKIYGLVR